MIILNIAHAFSSTFASTLIVGEFCRSTVYLGSWGRHLFLGHLNSDDLLLSVFVRRRGSGVNI